MDPLLEAALKPFKTLEALALPAQYERSFKLEPGLLITQRYMLSVRTQWSSTAQLIEAARLVGMPTNALSEFARMLPGASAVAFGFEGSEAIEGSRLPGPRSVLKVYTEHRSRLANRSAGAMPVQLFRGFKWQANRPDRCVQTAYWCRPGLADESIRAQIAARLATTALAPVHDFMKALLDDVLSGHPSATPQWIELGETDQPIRAFDLNLYDFDLRVAALAAPLAQLCDSYRICNHLLARLLNVAGNGLLGHVSAGTSREGGGFLTVYFEPVRSTE